MLTNLQIVEILGLKIKLKIRRMYMGCIAKDRDPLRRVMFYSSMNIYIWLVIAQLNTNIWIINFLML